jgi:hypothetical protein
MSETSRRVLGGQWRQPGTELEADAITLAREVEALEVERDAALARLAEKQAAVDALARDIEPALSYAQKYRVGDFDENVVHVVVRDAEQLRAKLAEVERERDARLRHVCQLLVESTGADGPLTAEEAATRASGQLYNLRARLALAEKVCEQLAADLCVEIPAATVAALSAWRAAKGGDAGASRDDATQVAAPADSTSAKGAPLRGGLGYNPDGPRCSVCTMPKCRCQHSGEPEHAEHCRCAPGLVVHERVPTTTGGLISSMPAGKPASPLPGGLGPSYTRAEVDVAIAQAKREVLEAVAQALESDRPGWKLAPELRKAASRG